MAGSKASYLAHHKFGQNEAYKKPLAFLITNGFLPLVKTGFLRLITDFAVMHLSYGHKINWSNQMVKK